MRDWTWQEWLIAAGFVAAAVLLLVFIIKSADAQAISPAGCRQTNYPSVCAASYRKCAGIGLDDACLAVARLDGQVGYDFTSGRQIPTSQNTFTGDKPVESVHK